MPKRRVFISYHHANEQTLVNDFRRVFADQYEVFTDSSLERAADSENIDYLTRICREGIKGTSVTIVLVGSKTGLRKFVDWEIDYTLDCQHGLLGIASPYVADSSLCPPERLSDNVRSGYAQYHRYPADASSLLRMIENAASASSSLIANTRPRRQRNG